MANKKGFRWGSFMLRLGLYCIAGPILGELFGGLFDVIDIDAVTEINDWD